ncbi:MAG: hypothetical protein KDN19_01690 [Verrucomicrobiae bacterium]|nr:hypothetical protein [Verrucomicrobiae bacterium]
MKAIFLDFDGVIRIPAPSFSGRPEAEFCSERKTRVSRLAEESGAQIVISSDWRRKYDRDQIERILAPQIPSNLLHLDWRTPLIGVDPGSTKEESLIPRGAEILCWLASHPELLGFVILDDMLSRFFPLMGTNLVSCQLAEGFTEDRYLAARNILQQAS